MYAWHLKIQKLRRAKNSWPQYWANLRIYNWCKRLCSDRSARGRRALKSVKAFEKVSMEALNPPNLERALFPQTPFDLPTVSKKRAFFWERISPTGRSQSITSVESEIRNKSTKSESCVIAFVLGTSIFSLGENLYPLLTLELDNLFYAKAEADMFSWIGDAHFRLRKPRTDWLTTSRMTWWRFCLVTT